VTVTASVRLVVLESGLKSVFAGLGLESYGLGLGLGLGGFASKSFFSSPLYLQDRCKSV